MSPGVANFLFEAANFLLLAAALGWILFAPVRRALDAERDRYVQQQQGGERLRAEAEAMAREARAGRESLARELEERRREILSAAEAAARELIEQGRRTQLAERRVLDKELATARGAEAAALAEAVGRIAAESVRRLLDALHGPELDAALARAACAELEALAAEARISALVESARPLDVEVTRLLERVLGDKFNRRIVPDLGAGVRVTTRAGQVDATAVSLARSAASGLTAAASEAETTVGAKYG